MEHWLKQEKAQWVHHEGSIRRPTAPRADTNTTERRLAPTERRRTEGNVLFNVALNTFYFTVIWRHEMYLRSKSVRKWRDGSSDRSFMVEPFSYSSFQPLFHVWYNKGLGMYYPVCGMMHMKEPLLCKLETVAHLAAAGFLSRYLDGPLPYVRHHITVTKCVECVLHETPLRSTTIHVYIFFCQYPILVEYRLSRPIGNSFPFSTAKVDLSYSQKNIVLTLHKARL